MKEIKLTQGFVTQVDDEDYEWLNKMKWQVALSKKKANKYVCGKVYLGNYKYKSIKMHRIILGITDPKILIDHKDGDGLNNQRNNIRIATFSQNAANRKVAWGISKYVGVRFRKKTGSWYATIKQNGAYKYLGSFRDEKDAARAYNIAAGEVHGEFASLNIIQ